jgi:hypothetical protein
MSWGVPISLWQSEVLECQGVSIKVCPAKQPIYSAEVETSVSSIYFQSQTVLSVCGRTVSTELHSPIFERNGSLLLYQLEVPRQLFLRCWNVHGWETVSFVLQGTGILSDAATSCHVMVEGLQPFTELQGETTFAAQIPCSIPPIFLKSPLPKNYKLWVKYPKYRL